MPAGSRKAATFHLGCLLIIDIAEGDGVALVLQHLPIYYPGFTIGGAVGEFGGILVTLALLLLTPFGLDFFLVLGAVAGLIAMQAVYWTMTHPVNSFWLKDTKLGSAGGGFFGSDPLRAKNGNRPADWTDLRDRWEYSHIVRAALGLASLAFLTGSLVA